MLASFLLEEGLLRQAGNGPDFDLGGQTGRVLLITLGITRIIEQQSLDISIWGSADGKNWGSAALLTFPQKFYCGTYQMVLDLSQKPETRFLQVRWKVNRWGKGDSKPLFGAYVYMAEAEESAVSPAYAQASLSA